MTTNNKIVVLGGSGMLGHKMFQILRGRFACVLCTIRARKKKTPLDQFELLQAAEVIDGVDVISEDDLRNLLSGLKPRFVVNCVGLIKQRSAASSAIPSITINSLLPHRLSEIASGWGGRVIHFSTDCVFSGRKGGYCEGDTADAEDLYGRTKFLGEITGPNALTLRTSIIGRELFEHRSLLDWFLSQKNGRVRGFRRVIYSGVTTNHLAETVAEIIEKKPEMSGLYQVASEPIAKFDLLLLLKKTYGLNVEIEPDDAEICDRSMLGAKFAAATGLVCPDWPELVRRLVADPTPYSRWLTLT